jgi:hypothetical protein
MAKSTKTNPASPTKASKPTKIPSPRRKKDGFSNKNKIQKVAKQNHCEIKVMATLGDEEMFFLLKPGYEDKLDAYCLHLKEDLERARPVQEDLNLVAGYPRRESRENQVVSLSHGKSMEDRLFISRYRDN